MSLSGLILKILGWKVMVAVPDYPKCIICVAPHTSNWDFVLGKLAYLSTGRDAGFLMKDTWFRWPLGYFFRAIGGVPVARKNKKGSLVSRVVGMFRERDRLTLAITPEGTRSRTSEWHTGFLEIARQAQVPICLGAFDFKTKNIYITETFNPSGDNALDIRRIKDYYSRFTACYPENFCTD